LYYIKKLPLIAYFSSLTFFSFHNILAFKRFAFFRRRPVILRKSPQNTGYFAFLNVNCREALRKIGFLTIFIIPGKGDPVSLFRRRPDYFCSKSRLGY